MKTEFISTLVLLAILIVYIMLKKKKEKNSSWKGELIKKRTLSDEDDEYFVYKFTFKTDQGKTVKVSVPEKIYNEGKIGDRYEKISGENVPKKLS